jgi:hypothetical protein
MLIKAKTVDGAVIVINTDHVQVVGQLADKGKPVIGVSAVMMLHGVSAQIQGTPEDFYTFVDEMARLRGELA